MRKSQQKWAFLPIVNIFLDTKRYIQASTNIGRKARRYWLSGVRGAVTWALAAQLFLQHLQLQPLALGRVDLGLGGAQAGALGGEALGIAAVEGGIGH